MYFLKNEHPHMMENHRDPGDLIEKKEKFAKLSGNMTHEFTLDDLTEIATGLPQPGKGY